MSIRKLFTCTLAVLLMGVTLQGVLFQSAQAGPMAAFSDGPGSRDQVVAALLEGMSVNNAGVGGFEISGPGLVSTRGQASGTLIVRGDPDFIYSGNLTVVNFGNSAVALALSDGTPLMTVPAHGSSTVRPYLALPPNELVYTSTGGTYTEFVWVSRSN